MSVKIRLKRMGTNNTPFFRIVAADARSPNNGRFIEALGWYDPKRVENDCAIKLDRVEYWQGQGAIVSDTVKSLISDVKNPDRKQKKTAIKSKEVAAKLAAAQKPAPVKQEEPAPVEEAAPAAVVDESAAPSPEEKKEPAPEPEAKKEA